MNVDLPLVSQWDWSGELSGCSKDIFLHCTSLSRCSSQGTARCLDGICSRSALHIQTPAHSNTGGLGSISNPKSHMSAFLIWSQVPTVWPVGIWSNSECWWYPRYSSKQGPRTSAAHRGSWCNHVHSSFSVWDTHMCSNYTLQQAVNDQVKVSIPLWINCGLV